MKRAIIAGLLLALAAAGCSRHGTAPADTDVRKTGFPGQVTAGGGTSGVVMAASEKRIKQGAYSGGTPHSGGGMEGNVGGAKLGGTVQESGQGPSGTAQPPKPVPNEK